MRVGVNGPMDRQTVSAKNARLIYGAVVPRTWTCGLIVLLAAVVLAPLAVPAPADDDTDSAALPWLNEGWQRSQTFWRTVATNVRWEHLPGLRMTTEKTYALWSSPSFAPPELSMKSTSLESNRTGPMPRLTGFHLAALLHYVDPPPPREEVSGFEQG